MLLALSVALQKRILTHGCYPAKASPTGAMIRRRLECGAPLGGRRSRKALSEMDGESISKRGLANEVNGLSSSVRSGSRLVCY
jgi:hypothetical protein